MDEHVKEEKEVKPLLNISELWKGNFHPDVSATFLRARKALDNEGKVNQEVDDE